MADGALRQRNPQQPANDGMDDKSPQPRKRCFVTIGATASFNSLIKEVLSPRFMQALHEHNYTELRIQYGGDRTTGNDSSRKNVSSAVAGGRKCYEDHLWALEGPEQETVVSKYSVTVSGFDFKRSGLVGEMRAARGDAIDGAAKGVNGVIVSHAGSGSILEALRIGVPLLVVPNPELMDNHQVELAEVLEQEKYVVHGRLDNLAVGLSQIEDLRLQQKKWPPINSKDRRGGLSQVIKEEMGWLD